MVPYISDPLTAETVAVWHAAQLGCELGIQKVQLEGDSLSALSDLKKEGLCGSDCGQLIFDTKFLLSCLDHCSFHHVKRDAKLQTGWLIFFTKFALSQLLNKVWSKDCPSIIQDIVIAEQNDY